MDTKINHEVIKEVGLAAEVLASIETGGNVSLRSTDWLNAIVKISNQPAKIVELRAVLTIARNQIEKIQAASSAV